MGQIMNRLTWHPEKNIDKIGFNEWVYFYFSSPRLHGIIIYGWAWRHPGVMSVQFFPKNDKGGFEKPVLVDDYHIPEVSAERLHTNYDTRLGSCELRETDNTFSIKGSLADNRNAVSWELDFGRLVPPVQSFKESFGYLWFEYIGWNVLSARSGVEGKVSINGREEKVDGFGYVDSNYGRWLVAIDPATDWNWLTAMDPESPRAVVGMNIRKAPKKGAIYYLTPDQTIGFPTNRRTFTHELFSEDDRTGLMKPVRTRVSAENREGYRLSLLVDNYYDFVFDQKFPLREAGIPLPLSLTWPLIENFVHVEGKIVTHEDQVIPVKAAGLKEYGVTSNMPYGLRKWINRKWLDIG
jgi:hypothetical protein